MMTAFAQRRLTPNELRYRLEVEGGYYADDPDDPETPANQRRAAARQAERRRRVWRLAIRSAFALAMGACVLFFLQVWLRMSQH